MFSFKIRPCIGWTFSNTYTSLGTILGNPSRWTYLNTHMINSITKCLLGWWAVYYTFPGIVISKTGHTMIHTRPRSILSVQSLGTKCHTVTRNRIWEIMQCPITAIKCHTLIGTIISIQVLCWCLAFVDTFKWWHMGECLWIAKAPLYAESGCRLCIA